MRHPRPLSRSLLAGLLTAATLVAPPALAQRAPDPSSLSESQRAQLGKLFGEARSAFEARADDRAVALLEEAYVILPDPNILFRIAEAHDRAGDYAAAHQVYERYLKAAPGAKDRPEVERRIAELDRLVAAEAPRSAVLVVDTTPVGATVFLDSEGLHGARARCAWSWSRGLIRSGWCARDSARKSGWSRSPRARRRC